jgi:hypothetical protein
MATPWVVGRREVPSAAYHLVSAAPDMLEALKLLSPAFAEGIRSGLLSPTVVQLAYDAIAKAEG